MNGIQKMKDFRQAAKILAASTVLYSTVGFAVQNEVSITTDEKYRYITSNGIPDHETGQFPNKNNPNRISEQHYVYRVPLRPTFADHDIPLGLSPFGVALNGIPFDPGAAEFWNNDRGSGWQYTALTGKTNLGFDSNNAHVQSTGSYHYHGLPTDLFDKLHKSNEAGPLLGYAADGFPIYGPYFEESGNLKELTSSYRLKKGTRPDGPGGTYDGTFLADFEYVSGAGDLDECNGYEGKTPEYPQGTYFYVISKDFPFVPRCFKGYPDPSFMKRGHNHRPPPRHHHRR